MKELVQYLARQLVNNPDAVEVKETQGDTASVVELKVAKEDLGRIIGKQGRTAKSIRTILNAAASRANRKVVLEIIEESVIGRHYGAHRPAATAGRPTPCTTSGSSSSGRS
jgi:predicted RNA-binding protein YlqC (UPF0109 family)